MSRNDGLVLWLTGLAGSGKSTLGRALYQEMRRYRDNVIYLDGDELRELLGHYGYSKEGRIEVAIKRSRFAHFLASQGMVVVVTTISLFKEIYAYNREHLKNYVEIYIQCPLEELIKRDQKGLYTKALNGEIKEVVGIDIPFDTPEADLVLTNLKTEDIAQNTARILALEAVKGFLANI